MCLFVIGFLKIAEYYSMLWMHCSLFKHSLILVYLDNFHVWLLQMSYHEHPCTSFCMRIDFHCFGINA